MPIKTNQPPLTILLFLMMVVIGIIFIDFKDKEILAYQVELLNLQQPLYDSLSIKYENIRETRKQIEVTTNTTRKFQLIKIYNKKIEEYNSFSSFLPDVFFNGELCTKLEKPKCFEMLNNLSPIVGVK